MSAYELPEPVIRITKWLRGLHAMKRYPYFTNGMFENDCIDAAEVLEEIADQMQAAFEAGRLQGEASGQAREDWVSVKDRLPDFDQPVWLFDGQCWIGGRIYDEDGWFWGRCYSLPSFGEAGWEGDIVSDDDYTPTHWMPLPPPAPTDTLRDALDAARGVT